MEVLASVISKTTTDLQLASLVSMTFAIVLWIFYRNVLPHRRTEQALTQQGHKASKKASA